MVRARVGISPLFGLLVAVCELLLLPLLGFFFPRVQLFILIDFVLKIIFLCFLFQGL